MLLAAALLRMCRLPPASVLTGHDAVIANPRLDQSGGQRVPRAGRLVREHQRQDAVRLQHPPALGEDRRHPLLVVAPGQRPQPGAADRGPGVSSAPFRRRTAAGRGRRALSGPGRRRRPDPGRIGHRLGVLVGQPAPEQLREDAPGGPLEPDVEEVGQLRVHDVVVIGRVHDDRVDAAGGEVVEAVAGLAGDGDRRRNGGRNGAIRSGAGGGRSGRGNGAGGGRRRARSGRGRLGATRAGGGVRSGRIKQARANRG